MGQEEDIELLFGELLVCKVNMLSVDKSSTLGRVPLISVLWCL